MIDLDAPLSPLERAMLNNAFEESDLPVKVDVMEWRTLSPSFREHLLLESVPLVRRAVTA